jgi:hypothetical protein
MPISAEVLFIAIHLCIKPFFQLVVIILNAFIATIIKEQAKRQAVSFPVLDYAGTAFAMVRT